MSGDSSAGGVSGLLLQDAVDRPRNKEDGCVPPIEQDEAMDDAADPEAPAAAALQHAGQQSMACDEQEQKGGDSAGQHEAPAAR